MRDRLKLADGAIAAALAAHYGLTVEALDFLPLGNDARSRVYRVAAGGDYFLKLRRGAPSAGALGVPHYLRACGIRAAVAPIPTGSGQLSAPLDECDERAGFVLVLYPWIAGTSAWDCRLSREQWREWGAVMRAIHHSVIPPALAAQVPRESFGTKWLACLGRIQRRLAQGGWQDEAARAMAGFWEKRQAQIECVSHRYRRLGARLEGNAPPAVLCHADIHRANLMIDRAGGLHIVDWDETIIAPKERDLMFFIGDGHSTAASAAFRRGYGGQGADALGLAYYRYDWVMQEFCDYGQRVFFARLGSAGERDFAFDEFRRLFAAGDVVERAQRAYEQIGSL